MVYLRSKVGIPAPTLNPGFLLLAGTEEEPVLNPAGWWPGPTIGILSAPADLSLSIRIYLSMNPLCSAIYLSERGLSSSAQKYAWGVSTLEVSYLSSLGWMKGGGGWDGQGFTICNIHPHSTLIIISIYQSSCKNPKYLLVYRQTICSLGSILYWCYTLNKEDSNSS